MLKAHTHTLKMVGLSSMASGGGGLGQRHTHSYPIEGTQSAVGQNAGQLAHYFGNELNHELNHEPY